MDRCSGFSNCRLAKADSYADSSSCSNPTDSANASAASFAAANSASRYTAFIASARGEDWKRLVGDATYGGGFGWPAAMGCRLRPQWRFRSARNCYPVTHALGPAVPAADRYQDGDRDGD